MNERTQIVQLKDTLKKVKICLNLQIKILKKDLEPFVKENLIINLENIMNLLNQINES